MKCQEGKQQYHYVIILFDFFGGLKVACFRAFKMIKQVEIQHSQLRFVSYVFCSLLGGGELGYFRAASSDFASLASLMEGQN